MVSRARAIAWQAGALPSQGARRAVELVCSRQVEVGPCGKLCGLVCESAAAPRKNTKSDERRFVSTACITELSAARTACAGEDWQGYGEVRGPTRVWHRNLSVATGIDEKHHHENVNIQLHFRLIGRSCEM